MANDIEPGELAAWGDRQRAAGLRIGFTCGAFDPMLTHAAALGANAVVGARHDATGIMSGVTEVLAYGAAAVVKPQG
jgi:hypothetical protein